MPTDQNVQGRAQKCSAGGISAKSHSLFQFVRSCEPHFPAHLAPSFGAENAQPCHHGFCFLGKALQTCEVDLRGVLVVGVRAEEQVGVGDVEGHQAHDELVQGDPWMGFTELGVKTGNPCQGGSRERPSCLSLARLGKFQGLECTRRWNGP